MRLTSRWYGSCVADVYLQGNESLKGTMVPTGPILELMDVLAGSISLRYAVVVSRLFEC